MKKIKTRPKQPAKLQERVEEFLHKNPEAIKKIPPKDIRNLFEDLQIYQAELENRNDELLKAQEALRNREKRFRNFLDNLGDAAYETDSSGNVTYGNKTAEIITGVPLKDIIGKPFLPLFTAESQKIAIDVYQRTLNGESLDFELTFNNGRICHFKNEPLRDKDDKIIGVFGIARDITERKQIEEALNKQTHALGERVKELNCLYGISKIRERNDIAFEEMLQEIVDLIPPSWQYPEITCARIIIEGQEYKTKNFKETTWKQTSNIVVHGKRIGILEICYLEEKPESDEGPFLKEERSLISAITERLGRVTEHKQAEGALRKAHDELEQRVEERTKDLEIKTTRLEEVNAAMKVLLEHSEMYKKELEEKVLSNIKELVDPYLEKLEGSGSDAKKIYLSIIKSNIDEIVSPFTQKLSSKYLNLTPSEIRIANLVKQGKTTKEMAGILNISGKTVGFHRENIRKKLGLKNKKANLRSHLLSLQ